MQTEYVNHLKVLQSKVVVLNVQVKMQYKQYQVGVKKLNINEPLMKRRNVYSSNCSAFGVLHLQIPAVVGVINNYTIAWERQTITKKPLSLFNQFLKNILFMHLNQPITVRGCITQEKYIKGKSLPELERILGFHTGRLRNGIVVAALQQTPAKDQFELLGYTQVAGHKITEDTFKGLEVDKLKDLVIKTVFSNLDVEPLVKVLPNTPHSQVMDDDSQYPPGQGVPQWKLTKPLDAKVVAIVSPNGKYL